MGLYEVLIHSQWQNSDINKIWGKLKFWPDDGAWRPIWEVLGLPKFLYHSPSVYMNVCAKFQSSVSCWDISLKTTNARKPYGGAGGKVRGITDANGFNCVATLESCGDPSHSCGDISVWTKVVDQTSSSQKSHSGRMFKQKQKTTTTKQKTKKNKNVLTNVSTLLSVWQRSCPTVRKRITSGRIETPRTKLPPGRMTREQRCSAEYRHCTTAV